MAVAETRLDNADARLTNVERDVRDLRRGEGFIEVRVASTVSLLNRATFESGPSRHRRRRFSLVGQAASASALEALQAPYQTSWPNRAGPEDEAEV